MYVEFPAFITSEGRGRYIGPTFPNTEKISGNGLGFAESEASSVGGEGFDAEGGYNLRHCPDTGPTSHDINTIPLLSWSDWLAAFS